MQTRALDRVPDVTLKAIGHGRAVAFNDLGTTTLVICAARETSDQPPLVTRAVRERYPDAAQLTIISLTDVRRVPRLVRKIAEQIMKSSYAKAVTDLEPGRDPERYVLIVPDWDGAVLDALGVDDVTKQIAISVLTPAGAVAATYQGDDAPTHALALLAAAGV